MIKQRRILHLRPSNFIGGPENQLLRYAEAETGSPFEIILSSFVGRGERSEFLDEGEKRGIRVLPLPAKNFGFGSALTELIRLLKRERIDLLCTHGFKADILGVFATPVVGIPIACFLRGWTGEDRKVQIYEAADAFFIRFADGVVCLSETQAEEIRRLSGLSSKVRVVGSAINTAAYDVQNRSQARRKLDSQFGLSPECRIIATAGRLSPEKGLSDFLQAAAEISRQDANAHFIVFGDGVLRPRLETESRALGLERIAFAGFRRDLRSLLPGVDLLVNPSHSEVMPNIVLEGMAAGVPMIATTVGGVRELAGHEEAIRLVPPRDPMALMNAMNELLSRPTQAEMLGQMARTRVENCYSIRQQISQMHGLYEEFLPGLATELATRNVEDSGSALPQFSDSQVSESSFLSVVMPVRNEASHILGVLNDLAEQHYPAERFELLVVDGRSTDGTVQLVQEFTRRSSLTIKLLDNPKLLSSAGRNLGAQNAQGEYIIFVDGHCQIPNKNYLRDVVGIFQKTQADCLCRPQPLSMPGLSPFQEVVAQVRATALGHGRDSTIYATELDGPVNPCSSGAMYRRSVFEQIGFYDERFDACEDVEFNYRLHRAGCTAHFSPRLAVCYQPRASLAGLFQQMVRYGRGRCRLALKHPGAFSFSQGIPAAVLTWLVIGVVASLFSMRLAAYFTVSLTPYLLLILGCSLVLAWRHGWRYGYQAPLVYCAIHFGLGAGFLKELGEAAFRGRLFQRKARDASGLTRQVTAVDFCTAEPAPGQDMPVVMRSAETPTNQTDNVVTNCLSVDVEDYFHTEAMRSVLSRDLWEQQPLRVESTTRRLFELFAAHKVRGTFFFLGWVADRFPGLVREASRLGHEVACHSYWHRLVYELTPEEFREDTRRAKGVIEDAAGTKVQGYRAPSYSIVQGVEWAWEILAELGFSYDSSVHPIKHDIYNNPNAPRFPTKIVGGKMTELPIATMTLGNRNLPIGGGGYFRILPYRYTYFGISRFNRELQKPVVFYVHPWEFDAQQPKLPLNARSRFRQYTGLSSNMRKLERLLEDFRFAPIREVYSQEIAAVPTTGAALWELSERSVPQSAIFP